MCIYIYIHNEYWWDWIISETKHIQVPGTLWTMLWEPQIFPGWGPNGHGWHGKTSADLRWKGWIQFGWTGWSSKHLRKKRCCFFFTAWWFRLVKKHLKLKFPLTDLFRGWQQPWRCWTVLGLVLSPKLFSSNASSGRGFQGLRGCGAWGYRAEGLTWTKNFHVHIPSGNLTYLLNMTMTYSWYIYPFKNGWIFP